MKCEARQATEVSFALTRFRLVFFIYRAIMRIKTIRVFCLILCLLSWTPSGGLFALPQGEIVESGSAVFERPDPATTNNIPTLNIIVDDKSVINFNSFNIAQNEAVYFIQPSASASVLSRVTGAGASEIAGILSANGTLFFVNQNGIRFTPSAQVNVNSLIASTLDISTNNFINGNYILEHSLDGVFSHILNEGRITGNNIALVASGVHNAGVIAARAGTTHLASGDKVTVSFDQKGLIQVEINTQTSGQVVDLQGNSVKDAVANSGTIEAKEVVMNTQTAANIFENAVNQTGIVKATAITQEGGVIRIRANRNIQVSGTLEAAAGGVTVASGESIAVKSQLNTLGTTNIMADKDIDVSANIETVNGDLALIADADLNGEGSFRQASETLISTINYGDIIIQSSGESTLANIMAAGDLILKQGGSAAIFTQHPGSHISTAGSLSIGQGVTLNAANTHYSIGKNLINAGSFDPQDSLVELVSDLPAIIQGSITFNDFKVIVPGKKVIVTAGDMITIEGILTLQGSYGDLLTIVSTEPGIQWKILPLGGTDIAYSQIGDCFNARGPPLAAVHSNSLGNNSNVLMNSYWTGQGVSNNWSDPDNWDSGIVPAQYDTVLFDGITGLYPFNNSFIDRDFSGTIADLVIDGYTGIVTLGRDITVTRDITLASGTLKAQNHTISVGGDWLHQGGDFQSGTSTVVFYDAAQPSFISGNSTFYNFTSTTPSKVIYFEAGTTTTITGTIKLQGSYARHVRLLSSEQGKQWYMDPQGARDITYTWVEDSYNLDTAIVVMLESTNRGNCFNWDPTATWTGNISNLWSVAGNWVGLGGAAPGAGDDLVFPAGCLTLNTSNDFAAGTSFNSITITGSGYTLAGNSITLGAGGLTTDAIAGSNTISLDIAFAATRTITVTNSDETLTISGVISGAAGVGMTKAGAGTLVLSGVNTYQGATTINAGTISIAADSGLGQAPGGATAGHLTFGAGTLLTTATFSLNSNRGIALGAGGGTLNVDTATVLTYGGIIAGSNPLVKLGAGELVLQGISTNDSTATLNGGTFTLSGVNGTMTSATFTVNQGAVLKLDNSSDGTNNLHRLNDDNAFTLTGGEFVFAGTSTAATNATETIGILTLPTGASRITVIAGTGGGTTVLTFKDVNRSPGATVLFRGDFLGNNPGANVSTIQFNPSNTLTNAANFIGTTSGALANDTTTNIKIIPWAFGDLSSAGSGSSFVTFNTDTNGGTNGIRPLKTTEYVANSFATASVNVRITANTNAAARIINSLLLDGGNVSYAGNLTVTVTSGAVARVSGGDIAATAANKSRVLTFGTAEGVIFAIGSFYIAPRLSGSAGLTISGGGTITFPAAATFGTTKNYTGTTTINEGGLTIELAAAIATSSVVTIAAPATFTKGNVALTVTTLNLYSGNTAGAQVVLGSSALTLLAAGGGTITLQVNGSGAVGATISTISTGTLALGASRTITVADGSAENDLTIAVVISGSSLGITKEGAGTLALTKANSYTGITTLNAGTLSVEILRNGGIACGVGASTNVATNLVFNGGTFKYTGVTVSTNRLFTIGTTSGVTFDVSGVGTLTFTGASMTLSGTDTARTITFTGTGSAVLTNVIPDNGAGATTVVKNGSGTWFFKGVNIYTGTTTINAGTLMIQADSGLGTAPGAATPGHINLNGGMFQTTADFTLNANRGIALTKAGTIYVDSSTTLTYGGIIAGSNIFTKDGAGTLILQGANTYSSATVVANGTLTLSGANGSILNSTSITINTEATLGLDNLSTNNFDRIADGVDIDMYGGYFILIGCDSAATFETVGALNIIAGSNYVTVRDSIGGATVMTFTSFSRISGAMVLFRGTNLGSAPGYNVSTIMFTAAPVLTGGGGAAGTTTVSIIQGAFGSNSPSGTGTDMVTYNINDNAFGLRLLNEGGFTGEYETSVLTVPNSNVKLSTSVAPGAGITINSLILASGGAVATSANTLTIASGNILALEGNGGINGSSVLAFGATPGIIRAVGDLTISSQITGSAGLTTGGVGTITLSNASNSFTGGIRISQGIVKISEDADLGSGSGAGYITFFGGTLRTTADFTLNSNRGILLKSIGTIFTDPGTTLTYNGIIAGVGSLIKDGTGTLLLGGANTYNGDTTINAGALTMTAANTYTGATIINGGTLTLSGANGTALYSSSFTINQGGTFILDNTTANNINRINNGSSLILTGGEFIFKGSNVESTDASETIGSLVVSLGASKVTVFSGTGGSTVLTFDEISRDSGATVLFRGTNLGSAAQAGNTNILFTDDTGLAMVGVNTSATNKPIVPFAFGDTAVAGAGTSFVTYNINQADNNANTDGIRPLDLTTEYTQNAMTSGTNVRITVATNASATVAVNSLLIDGASLTYSANCTVTVTSGAVARVSGGDIAASASSTSRILTFGTAEGVIFAIGSFYISPRISGSGGLTISGGGTVEFPTNAASYFGATKNYTGTTTINEGGLNITYAAAIATSSVVTVAAPATFTKGDVALTVTTLNLYSGNTSGASVVFGSSALTLLAAGGGCVNLLVNGSGAVGATISTINTGTLALGASRTITVNDGSAADDLTISVAISGATFGITKAGSGTLVLSGNNTYTGANVINGGTLAVTVNNALGTNAAGTTVNAGTLDFRNVAYSTTEALTLATGSFLTASTGTSSFAGAITMTALSMIEVNGTQLTLSGTIANGGYRLIVDGTGNTIISNTLTGDGGLAKQGTGTLTLSNTVTLGGNFSILRGTLVLGSNTVTVSGNWTNNATFTCGTSTVTFNGGSSTIDSGGTGNGQAFYKVIINSTGTKTLANAMMVNNVLQVDAGTLAGDYDVTVKGGSVTGNGIINMTDGTFTVRFDGGGTGNFGGSSGNWIFYDLTFGDGVTTAATTKTGNNTITITGTLAIALYHTLQAGSSTWNLVWTSYLKNIVMIASGYDHTIALTDDGYVFAWGCNAYGQLGDGTTDDGLTPVQVLAGEQGEETYLHDISSISAGGYHSVALTDDGYVLCWGYNEYGQLGDDTTTNSLSPVKVHDVDNVGDLAGIASIAAGGFETAAVSSAGYVFCWGYNGEGELGNDSIIDSHIPVQVLSGEQGNGTYLHDISMVAVGGCFVIAVDTAGYAYSWGYNEDGELGNGATADSHTPVRVLSGEQGGGTYLHDISMVAAGDVHSLALATTGYVYSWGYNIDGQLGNGTTVASSTPVQVLSGEQGSGTYLQNVTNIAAGGAHSLAIASGGYVFSWGQNTFGQLGNNSDVDSSTPVQVLSGDQGSETYLHGIADIAAGGAQTVALSQARPVFNCGNNANGQLGNGTTVGAVDQIRVHAGSQAGPVITQLEIEGVLLTQTSTFNFSDLFHPSLTIPDITYFNLTLSNNQGSFWLTGDTDVLGDLVIDHAVLSADTYNLNVSGNWTNNGGTFNADTGTVTLNSSTQAQSVTSGGSAFNILTITNTYSGGVAFVDRLVTAYLNAGTGVEKLSFSAASASQPHTITASFNVSGSAGSLIELAPLVAATTWYISTPESTLHHLTVSYSNNVNSQPITAASSTDPVPGSNTNWDISP